MLRFLLFTLLSCVLALFNSFAQFTHYDLVKTGENVDQVTSIGITNSSEVFIGTYNKGIVKYDGIDQWTSFDYSSTSDFPNDYITSVYISNADVWCSTLYGGVGKYSQGIWSTINSSSGLPSDETYGVQLDVNGNIHISTYEGLAIDSVSKDLWAHYNMNVTPALATEGTESFYSILLDPGTGIWLGTQGNGLAKLSENKWHFFNSSNSDLPDDYVNVIKKDLKGNLWVGTENGLARFDGTNWVIFTSTSTNSKLPSNKIRSIDFNGTNDVIYVATDQGLGVYTISTNAWVNYKTTNSNLPENDLKAVAVDPANGDLWVGTASKGLAVIKNSTSIKDENSTIRSIKAFPNPVSELLTISFSTIKENEVKFYMTDSYGRVLKQFGLYTLAIGEHSLNADVSDIEAGFYFLVIESNRARTLRKIRVY